MANEVQNSDCGKKVGGKGVSGSGEILVQRREKILSAECCKTYLFYLNRGSSLGSNLLKIDVAGPREGCNIVYSTGFSNPKLALV